MIPYLKWKSLFDHPLLVSAIVIAGLFHGTTFINTMPKTYDAYVHIFFADHYAKSWFEPWEYRWYTGFTATSYPPLLHQSTAILSFLLGLKGAFIAIFFLTIMAFVVGVYRFSKLWVSEAAAQYAALLSIVAPSIVEAAHVFGQLPTLVGITLLLNALPEVYYWIRGCGRFYFVSAISLLLVVACTHHVTVIFGQVFFVFPTIAVAIFDRCDIITIEWNIAALKKLIARYIEEIFTCFWRIAPFFIVLLLGIIAVIFPYWYLTKTDPIAQVSIPHGSRDNFLLKRSSGTMFFAAMWGMLLPFFFYALRRSFQNRNLFLFLPFVMLFVFGTGGTTPIPKLLLGENAFNILTLDRFTFWGTMLTLPFAGEFLYLLIDGPWGEQLKERWGRWSKRFLFGYIIAFFLLGAIILSNLGNWNITQPQTIDIKPIVSFLSRDEHFRWRYLTLGFGDQVAWLSANTEAQCIDGNYHSARRLPELTTRAIERLENAKFSGVEGIGSLQQFLTVPEKYHLKYIFSNDKFYDPLLFYAGWNRVQRLENGIMVWEKQDIPKIPPQVPAVKIPDYQKIMWGIVPISVLLFAFITMLIGKVWRRDKYVRSIDLDPEINKSLIWGYSLRFWKVMNFLIIILPLLLTFFVTYDWLKEFFTKEEPEKIVISYYDFLDRKLFSNVHKLFEEEKDLSFEQYVLEISVEDGILSSFAKLDAIETELLSTTDTTALVRAKTKWVTPLESYERTYEHLLHLHKGKWRLKPKTFDLSIPPDESFRRSLVMFFNQGKRRVSTAATNMEDVLDRPELNIPSARLVKNKDRYSVVGEIQNTDNYPAYITLTAVLFDKDGQKITEYNPLHCIHHKVLPKEYTAFRVDFEDVLWKNDSLKVKFMPGAFIPYVFDRTPVSFKVFAQAVSEEKDIFKNGDLQQLALSQNKQGEAVISGQVINSGVDEITIPQLIIAYYNQENQVEWVEKEFLPYGVRPQRRHDFVYKITNLDAELKTIYIAQDNDKYVNGLLNNSFISSESKIGTNIPESGKLYLNPKRYIQISVNSFLSAPTLY